MDYWPLVERPDNVTPAICLWQQQVIFHLDNISLYSKFKLHVVLWGNCLYLLSLCSVHIARFVSLMSAPFIIESLQLGGYFFIELNKIIHKSNPKCQILCMHFLWKKLLANFLSLKCKSLPLECNIFTTKVQRLCYLKIALTYSISIPS